MKTCTNCKTKVQDDFKFCPNCGHPFLKKVKVGLDEVFNKPTKKLAELNNPSKSFNQKTTDEKLIALNTKLNVLIKLLRPKK